MLATHMRDFRHQWSVGSSRSSLSEAWLFGSIPENFCHFYEGGARLQPACGISTVSWEGNGSWNCILLQAPSRTCLAEYLQPWFGDLTRVLPSFLQTNAKNPVWPMLVDVYEYVHINYFYSVISVSSVSRKNSPICLHLVHTVALAMLNTWHLPLNWLCFSLLCFS